MRSFPAALWVFGLVCLLTAFASPGGAREVVRFSGYSAGTIVIKTSERRLYYVTGENQAIRYPVGVGKAGMAWTGTASIDGK
jgi:lipoprotein-anchoring transpeptidase ErfK/SrfK